jgi:AI-2 transport protein TqsA
MHLPSHPSRTPQLVLLGLIAAILLGWALRASRAVSLPFAFALFVALLLQPVERWGRARLPGRRHWRGVGLAALVLLAVLGARR